MKPEFLVIGGMKCGTSALYSYLSQQKGIYLPDKKNIEYFCDEYWGKGIEWYESFFPGARIDSVVIGEISSEYSKYPHRCNVPERIAQVLPDIKLIYLVRHPIHRMISHYIHSVSNLSEKRSIELALAPGINNQYIDFSLYYMQLEQYLPYFDRDKILIIKSEDLLERPQEIINRIFEFVGAAGVSPVRRMTIHTRKDKRKWNPLGRLIRRSPRLFDLFNYYKDTMPKGISRLMLRAVSCPLNIEVLPRYLQSDIVNFIQDDVESLCSFAGEEFAGWRIEKH